MILYEQLYGKVRRCRNFIFFKPDLIHFRSGFFISESYSGLTLMIRFDHIRLKPRLLITMSPTFRVFLCIALVLSVLFVIQASPPTARKLDQSSKDVWFKEGERLTKLALYDSANVWFAKAAEIFQEEQKWDRVVACRNFIGDNERRMARYDLAFAILDSTLKLGEKKLGRVHADVAGTINKLGLYYRNKGDYDNALASFEEALKIRLRTLPTTHEDLGWSYNNLGMIEHQQGHFHRAITYFTKARDVFVSNGVGSQWSVAVAGNNIGTSYMGLGDDMNALSNFMQSLGIRKSIYGSNHLSLSQSYVNIANVYSRIGDFSKAEQYSLEALRIRLPLLGESHPDVAKIYYNLGVMNRRRDEYEEAIHYLTKAMGIYTKSLGFYHLDVARTWDELGESFLNQRHFDQAIDAFRRSLSIWDKIDSTHYRRAYNYRNIARVYEQWEQFDAARNNFEQALYIRRSKFGEKHPEVAEILLDLCHLSIHGGNYKNAKELNRQARISLHIDSNMPQSPEEQKLAIWCFLLAGDLELIGRPNVNQLELAFTEYRKASDLSLERREILLDENSQIFWSEIWHSAFAKGLAASNKLFEVTGNSKWIIEAFNLMEKSRSYLLTKYIGETRLIRSKVGEDSLVQHEVELRNSIGRLWSKIQGSGSFEKASPEDRSKLLSLESTLQAIRQQLKLAHPEYHQAVFGSVEFDSSKTSEYLRSQNLAVIGFFWSDTAVYVQLVSPTEFRIQVLGLTHSFLSSLNRFRIATQTSDVGSVQAAADSIAQVLLPVLNPVLRYRNLVVIPDGPLTILPFEILRSNESNSYMIESHAISYAYSINSIVRQFHPLSGDLEEVLGIAPFSK